MRTEDIKRRIEEALSGAKVTVNDLTGTGDHFEAAIIAEQFAGKSLIERHQMVYAPFKQELASGELHAFALKTISTDEVK